jgi:murein DD-endopeptidase MepM/ murein hydrolase activator NlpD
MLLIPLSGCGGSGTSNQLWALSRLQTSDYVLPYAVGSKFEVNQGNCSGFGHSAFWTYGYDFIMDIGTQVTAMRSGTVFHVQDGTPDGNRAGINLIIVAHLNGTFALYSHIIPKLLQNTHFRTTGVLQFKASS